MTVRTLFLGNEGHILEFIISQSIPVTGVVCTPVSEIHSKYFGSAENIARQHDLPILRPKEILIRYGGDLERIPKADLVIVNGFLYLLEMPFIKKYALGCINLHASILPFYRGRHPLNWAIINGEKYSGATLHYIDEDFDAGDIIESEKFPIVYEDNILDVYKKYIEAGKSLIQKYFTYFYRGTIPRTSQDKKRGSYYPPRKPEDGMIDWNASVTQIYNLVRALVFPYPGAFTFCKGKKITIWKCSEEKHLKTLVKPGTIIKTEGNLFWVNTRRGVLKVIAWKSDGGFSPIKGLCLN